MNTRHEILLAQSISDNVKLSPNGCFVSKGKWIGPYSGNLYTRASDLDVDHVIPLKWAHENGGANWSHQQKEQFANDPLNLLAVDDGLNQSKGASGPYEWMPPLANFHCNYLTLWKKVLDKYRDLKMPDSEKFFIKMKTQGCQRLSRE